MQEKLDEHLQKHQAPQESKLWFDVAIYSLFLFVVISLYYFASRGNYDTRIANRVIADISMLLIGLSMMLSSVCYFWNFADKYIIYRKHLGIAGFAYAMAHSLLSLFFMPKVFPFPEYYLSERNIFPFICALISLIIFTVMTIISNKFAIHELGGSLWRKLLRVGYIAYALAIIHFGLKGAPYWWSWLIGKSENIVPSFSMYIFLFGCIVIYLRIKLFIATRHKKI